MPMAAPVAPLRNWYRKHWYAINITMLAGGGLVIAWAYANPL